MPERRRPRLLQVTTFLITAAVATAAPSARAHADTAAATSNPAAPTIFLGAELAVGSPMGDFDKYVDTSLGFALHLGFPIASVLSLRIDAAHIIYGSDTWKTMNPSFPGVSFEMDTENTMTFFGLGPQLTGRLGPIRPFVNASFGFVHLATSTSLRGNGQTEKVAEDTNFRDFALAYGGGAGIAIPIPKWNGLTFSLGAFYQAGGDAEYVQKGGLVNNGDGSVSPITVHSETGILRYQVGLTFGL